MNRVLSMERDSYLRDYQRLLEAELQEADERRSRRALRLRMGRKSSGIRRIIAGLLAR